MKVVINSCYGGFGLSPKAIARLAELRGQKAYFFKRLYGEKEELLSVDEVKGLFWEARNTPTPTKIPTGKEWWKLTNKEMEEYNAKYRAEKIDNCKDNRTDPLLIQVVEELGETASGDCAKLRIVEIPDDVSFEIDEYDGYESIHETHRSWN